MENFSVPGKSRLFSGMEEGELKAILGCLQAKQRSYDRGEYILRAGEPIRMLAVLSAGQAYIQQDDYWGNRSIQTEIGVGEIFGEAYAMADGVMQQDVVATEPCTVLFLDLHHVLTACSNSCPFHARLIQNLFVLMAEKNARLTQKLRHMSRRSSREKLLSYLSEQSRKAGSASFTIPFNRQQLADFLSVDRSAMSTVLSQMQREGLLTCEKNRFTLHEPEG